MMPCCITDCWFDFCVQKDIDYSTPEIMFTQIQYVSPPQRVVPVQFYHLPLLAPLDRCPPPLEGVVLAMSTYTGREKHFLVRLTNLLGAKCVPHFTYHQRKVVTLSTFYLRRRSRHSIFDSHSLLKYSTNLIVFCTWALIFFGSFVSSSWHKAILFLLQVSRDVCP